MIVTNKKCNNIRKCTKNVPRPLLLRPGTDYEKWAHAFKQPCCVTNASFGCGMFYTGLVGSIWKMTT